MGIYLIVFAIGIVIFLVKITIDIYAAISVIRKDKKLLAEPNELENNYQFIKGLY